MRLAVHILREDRALARAAKRVPRPMPWDYARPRIVPLLCGPSFDRPGEEVMRAVAGPGCAIEFGIDLGGVFPLVDQPVADRWECTSEQLREVALANLRPRLERLPASAVSPGALSGRIIRTLRLPRGLASSAVLLSDQLIRIFGQHDQIFGAPSRSLLVSFPLETPRWVVAETVVDLEESSPLPLLLDPFVLHDGKLIWQPVEDSLDLPGR
jgi:hypothetical protein